MRRSRRSRRSSSSSATLTRADSYAASLLGDVERGDVAGLAERAREIATRGEGVERPLGDAEPLLGGLDGEEGRPHREAELHRRARRPHPRGLQLGARR